MISETLDKAIREAVKNYSAARAVADANAFSQSAKAAEKEAKALRDALLGVQIPGVLVKPYLALRDANDAVLRAIEPVQLDPAQAGIIRNTLEEVEDTATRFQEEEAIFAGAFQTEPLLSDTERGGVVIAAIVLFAIATLFGTLGNSTVAGAWATTLAKWLGAASFALLAVWMLAYFAVRKRGVSPRATEGGISDMQYAVFGGMAFLVLGFLFYGVVQGNLINILVPIPSARGLITFLVAISTMAIAVILTLASILMQADKIEVLKERLSRGKEILAILVGVLGTIVGFYFASNSDGTGGITVGVVDVSSREVEPGGQFTVKAMTTGGEMPYEPTAIIEAGEGVASKGSVNAQGFVSADITVGADVKPGPLPVTIVVRDKRGRTASTKAEIQVTAKKQ